MPSSKVSTDTPSQTVSSFVHFVTQWMYARLSSLGSARNASQSHVLGSVPSTSTVNVHRSSGVGGVGPADRTGKSSVTYWPGGTRELSRSFARLPLNPRVTKVMRHSELEPRSPNDRTPSQLAARPAIVVGRPPQ